MERQTRTKGASTPEDHTEAASTGKARRDGLPLCEAAGSFIGGQLWDDFEDAKRALADHQTRLEDAQRQHRRDEWRILRRDDETGWFEERLASPHAQERARLEKAFLQARQAVLAELWRMLTDGRLAATGRRGGPTAEVSKIPTSAWDYLRVRDWDQSVLVEQTPEKRRLFDVQIFATPSETVATAATRHVAGSVYPWSKAWKIIEDDLNEKGDYPSANALRAAVASKIGELYGQRPSDKAAGNWIKKTHAEVWQRHKRANR